MKLKIATRTLNCEYFIEFFLDYYIKGGADEIFIFDSDSNDRTKEIIRNCQKKNCKIHFIVSSKDLRHINEKAEQNSCNTLLKFALNDFLAENNEIWWAFIDIDEFIHHPKNLNLKSWLKQRNRDTLRTVFFDLYLPPELIKNQIKAKDMIQLAKRGGIKGIIPDLWGDPFFKDNVLRLNKQNIKKFETLKAGGGFHRWTLNKKLYLPSNKEFLVVYHLQGIPINIIQEKIRGNLKLLASVKDEWIKVHFQKVSEIFDNYNTFYDQCGLKSITELNEITKNISNYNNDKSYFNNVIMREYIENSDGSRPSKHGYNGFDI